MKPSSTTGVLSAALLLLSFGSSAQAWSRPGLCMVERVAFAGQQRAGARELRHLADLRNGTTVWSVDLEAVERGVERHPWVRDARATFDWPDTVRIEVEEHHTVALLHHGDRLLYLSEEGVAFLEARPGDLDYPHITGVTRALAATHPELPGLAVRDALWLMAELDARGLVPRSAVSEVAFSEALGFTVHAGAGQLSFGHGELGRQVDRLAVLVGQGLDPLGPTFVDLAPASVAIVRSLAQAPSGGGAPPVPPPTPPPPPNPPPPPRPPSHPRVPRRKP